MLSKSGFNRHIDKSIFYNLEIADQIVLRKYIF